MDEWLQVLLRAIISYFVLLILCKLMGKRQLSQMNFFDYVVGITIGSLTANTVLQYDRNYLILIPGLLAFAFLQIISSILTLKSKTIRDMLEGKKTILIENGKIKEKNLVKERLNMDRIESLLRDKNVFRLEDVDTAYLETNGKITVLKKTNKQPVTPNDLHIEVKSSGIGLLIIEQGKLQEQSLRELKLTKSWLMDKLASKGINDINEVMFAQADKYQNLYIDLYQKNSLKNVNHK